MAAAIPVLVPSERLLVVASDSPHRTNRIVSLWAVAVESPSEFVDNPKGNWKIYVLIGVGHTKTLQREP